MKMKRKICMLALLGAMLMSTACASNDAAADKSQVEGDKAQQEVVASNDANQVEETNSLYFDFDKDKFELVHTEGENIIYLMDKGEQNSNVFASWKYIPLKDAETVAKEELEAKESYKQAETDLEIKSFKVIDYLEQDNPFNFIYFIDDNAGGVYRLSISAQAFNDWNEDAINTLVKSVKVVSKDENENLKNIKEVKPMV